jgi:hypothetical protein
MINKREKRKRIFYVPGMISLVFIPLFCFYHFYKVDAFEVYSSLEFSVPDKNDFKKYKVGDLRKYRLFCFEDKKSLEKQQLKELRYFVRDLVKRYDNVNGAKIHFGSNTDYDTFVDVINIMTEEKMPFWALFSDNMYAFAHARPKPKKNNGFFCGTTKSSIQNTIIIEEETRRKELDIFIASFIKRQWIIFLGYLGLLFLNIFALVKFNKTR